MSIEDGKYATVEGIMELFEVSRATVANWQKTGLIHVIGRVKVDDGAGASCNAYDSDEVIAFWRARKLAKVERAARQNPDKGVTLLTHSGSEDPRY